MIRKNVILIIYLKTFLLQASRFYLFKIKCIKLNLKCNLWPMNQLRCEHLIFVGKNKLIFAEFILSTHTIHLLETIWHKCQKILDL